MNLFKEREYLLCLVVEIVEIVHLNIITFDQSGLSESNIRRQNLCSASSAMNGAVC